MFIIIYRAAAKLQIKVKKKNTLKMQYHILISALLMMVQSGVLIPQLILVYLIPFSLLNLELKFKFNKADLSKFE